MDIYYRIEEEMFKLLVAGKEVIIEQANGDKLHFSLADMSRDTMKNAIDDAFIAEF